MDWNQMLPEAERLNIAHRAKQEPVAGNTQETRPTSNAYFPALDGLRALAFLMVFGIHYLQLPWGWAGVDVFFVLSGFLITGILLDTRADPHRIHNFYVRRTLRIFPLYYGLMILLVIVYPIFRWQWTWAWLVWPAYLGNFAWFFYPVIHGSKLTMLATAQPLSRSFPAVRLYFGHFWSLCVEEQFYLFWPWIVFWIKDRRKLMYLCVACVVACPLLRVLAGHTLPPLLLHANTLISATPLRVDALLLGGLIALAQRGPWARQTLTLSKTIFVVLSVMTIFWIALNVVRRSPEEYLHPAWAFTWGISFFDLLSACVIVMALEYGSLTFHIFNFRPLRWLGRISYGAYVFHDIPHPIYNRLAGHYLHSSRLGAAAIALPSTVLFAWASFQWFESGFIRLKQRWTR